MAASSGAAFFVPGANRSLHKILNWRFYRKNSVTQFTFRILPVSILRHMNCLQRETGLNMESEMNQENKKRPLSESSVSLRLVDIQKRCSELLEDPHELDGLSLEDPIAGQDSNNPYSRS